jgi:5-methyltetrahydrofolate--homocysteine methyltransferase
LGGVDDSAEAIAEAVHTDLCRTRYHGDAFPKWWPNFGPGVMAAFVGGELHANPETTWFTPGLWAGTRPADIHPTHDAQNRWWRRVQDVTRAVAERCHGMAAIGHTDLGGNLDVAASLRDTQTLLTDCLDDPDGVGELCGRLTSLWLRYFDETNALLRATGVPGTTPWATIWSPGTCYMLQSDFSYMISPKQFKRWVVPDLVACCARMDHSFYHLDGKGELPHLDHLLAIEDLDGVQWIPGDGQPPSADPHWHWVLKKIRDAGKLVQLYGSGDVILRLAREVDLRGFILHTWGGGMEPAELVAAIQTANADVRRRAMVSRA